MDIEATRERIRKLLALARNAGAFSAEASLAMEKATRLMAELGLSEEELSLTEGGDGKIVEGVASGPGYKLNLIVAEAAASLYGAVVTCSAGNAYFRMPRKIAFHGPPEVVDACQQTYEWFLEQIENYYKLAKEDGVGKGQGSRWKIEFQRAAALRVGARCRDITRNMTVQAGDGRSLVVADRVTALKQRIRERGRADGSIGTGTARSQQIGFERPDAIARGRAAGDAVQLNQAMSKAQTNSTRLIGK